MLRFDDAVVAVDVVVTNSFLYRSSHKTANSAKTAKPTRLVIRMIRQILQNQKLFGRFCGGGSKCHKC